MTALLHESGNGGRAADRARISGLAVLLLVAVAIPVTAVAQPPVAPALRPGDIVTMEHVDLSTGSNIRGRLVRLDPSTRARTTLSDFGDPSQGPINPISPPGGMPVESFAVSSLVVEDATAIFVVHPFFGTNRRGALLHADPSTGVRTIISDFGDASQGPLVGRVDQFDGYAGLAAGPSGDFFLIDSQTGALVRVDRSTGMRAIVSDPHDPAQGPSAEFAQTVAVDESGQIVVRGSSAGLVAMFRIDPSTGVHTVLSEFEDPVNVSDVTVDSSGNILVVGWHSSGGFPFVLTASVVLVDPVTGTRSPLVDLVRTCGLNLPPVEVTFSLAVEETGDILVVVGSDVSRSVRRVDPTTGVCTFVGIPAWPNDVAVVPTPLVNERVSLSVASSVLDPPVGGPSAPAGVFRITATFTNVTSIPIRKPFFRVTELSRGNLLVNGDRPPEVIALTGKGARLTPDVGADGVLSPGESVMVDFAVGLQTRQPFTFFVNVFGEPDASESSQ